MLYIALIYFALLSFLTYKNFSLGFALFAATLPAYLIRFSIGPLPATLLEVGFFAILIGVLLSISKIEIKNFLSQLIKHKGFFLWILVFLFASIIGVYISTIGSDVPGRKMVEALGEWRAFFAEPMIVFLLLVLKKDVLKLHHAIVALFTSAVVVSIVALIQKLTGTLFPPSIANSYLFGRVTSVYTSANAIGLFTAPIVFLVLTLKQTKKAWIGLVGVGVLFVLVANYFSQSQGAWIAIGAGALVYLFIKGYRKIAVGSAVLGIVAGLAIPMMRQAILFEDRAGKNRLELWSHTAEYLTESPQQFIFGTGIRNFFDSIQKPFFNPDLLEALKYPHNIVLNFWTEIGLFGMMSFIAILVYVCMFVFRIQDTNTKAAMYAAFIVLVVQGLVDVPYFKNDLAMLFWILVFIAYTQYHKNKQLNA